MNAGQSMNELLSQSLQREIEKIVQAELDEAKVRLQRRLPELMALAGISIQQALSATQNEAYLTIVLRPKL